MYFAYIGLNKIIIKINFTSFSFFKTRSTKKHKMTSGLMFVACIIFLSDSDILSHHLGLNLGICELVRGRRVKMLSIFVTCFFFFMCQDLVAAHGTLVLPCGSVGSSSLTRGGNWAPCLGSAES